MSEEERRRLALQNFRLQVKSEPSRSSVRVVQPTQQKTPLRTTQIYTPGISVRGRTPQNLQAGYYAAPIPRPQQNFGQRVRDVFDANTPMDFYRRQSTSPVKTPELKLNFDISKYRDPRNIINDARRAYGAKDAGVLRSGIGLVQGISGIYDLATPGKGTNRLSDVLDRKAKRLDTAVKKAKLPVPAYKAGQLQGDVATLLLGGEVVKGVTKGAEYLPKVGKVSRIVEQGGATLDKLRQSSRTGKALVEGAKLLTRPNVVADEVLNVGAGVGQRTSKGQEIRPWEVALDVGLPIPVGLAQEKAALRASRRLLADELSKTDNAIEIAEKLKARYPRENPETIAAAAARMSNETDGSVISRVLEDADNGIKVPRVSEDVRVPRGKATVVDETTDLKIGQLLDEASGTPRPEGTTRIFQVGSNQGFEDYAFTDIDSLASYMNNSSAPDAPVRFADVPNTDIAESIKGANVVKLKRPTTPQATQEAVQEVIQEGRPITAPSPETQAAVQADNAATAIDTPVATAEVPGATAVAGPQEIVPTYEVAPRLTSELRQEFGQKFLDDDTPIILELKNLEKQTGQTGLVDQFLFTSGRARRANSIATQRFSNSEEIQQALGGLDKVGLAQFNEYATARRELANARMGLPTSRSLEELESVVQAGEEVFGQRYNSLRDYYFSLASDLKQAGIISEEKFQEFVSDPDYIRLQRDLDDIFTPPRGSGKAYSVGSTITSQKRTGSQRGVLPVAETALEYTQKIQNEIERNLTARSLVEMLGDSSLAKEVSQKAAQRNNVIKFIDNGAVRYFEVSKDIAEAVQRIKPFQLGIFGRIIAAPGRTFRAGTTALNPVFTVSNFARDQATSAILSKDAPATSKYFLSGLGEAIKDYGVGNSDPIWQKFLQVAGDTTSYDLTRNIKKTSQVVGEIAGGNKTRVKNALLTPVRTLEDLNSVTEKATRFQNFKGIYQKALDEGMSEGEAIQEATLAAWNTTIDFNRAGEWSRTLNLVFPYFNPAIQGSRRLAVRLAEAPVQTLLKGTAFVGMPLATATLWNLSDPERAEIYANIPDYEKENNLLLVMPGTKQNPDGTYNVLKLPFPPGISNLYQPVRRGIEAAMGDNPIEAGKVLADIGQAFTGPINLANPSQNLSTAIPQGIKPAVQFAANTDFYTGKQTVPDYIKEAGVSPKEEAYKFTSGTARAIGSLFGKSPIKVEKFVKDTFGSGGAYVLNAVDNLLANGGVIPKEQVGGQSIIDGFQRRFAKVQGIENYQKSEGAKFFDSVGRATAGLNKTEKEAFFGTILPSKTDFKGNQLNDKTYYDSANKATTWLRYPKTFEASKQIDAEQRKKGKPGDPLYDLPADRLKVVLNTMANYSPGNFEEKAMEKLNPWLKDFNAKRSAYFDKIIPEDKKNQPDAMGLTVPKMSSKQEKLNKQFASLKDGKQRAVFLADNPELADFFDKSELYQRVKRSFLGLPQFDKYPATPKKLQSAMDFYSSLPKGTGARSSWIKANQGLWNEMTNQWAKSAEFQAAKQGATAVYEGIDLEDKTKEKLGGGSSSGGFSGGGRTFNYKGKTYRVKKDGTVEVDKPKKTYALKLLQGAPKATLKAPNIPGTRPRAARLKISVPKRTGRRRVLRLK